MIYCSHCGEGNIDDGSYCIRCGSRLGHVNDPRDRATSSEESAGLLRERHGDGIDDHSPTTANTEPRRGAKKLTRWAVLAVALALVVGCIVGTAVQASAKTVAVPVVVSFSISPKTVPVGGGSITLTVRVRNATTCVFGGAGQVTKSCANGTASVKDTVVANATSAVKRVSLWVYAKGYGRRSALKTATFAEAAVVTSCAGSCTFTFPTPDVEGAASIALNSVSQDIAWPDPNYYMTAPPAGNQLDALNATVCAGPTGITDVGFNYADSLSLSVSSGLQATMQPFVDDSVPGDLENYGAIAPGQCVTGNMYVDAPAGSTWAIVNFLYEATNGDTLTYIWNAS